MDLQEVGFGYMDWIGLAQDRDRWRTLVSAVPHVQPILAAGKEIKDVKLSGKSDRCAVGGESSVSRSTEIRTPILWWFCLQQSLY